MSRASPSSHEMLLGLARERRKGADSESFLSNQAAQ